jgi:membrane protein implicated in regulation of membrane protease activity
MEDKKSSQNRGNESAKALLWFSGIVIFLGFAVMSPVPKPMLFLLAAFLSIIAFILGNKVTKIS